MSVLDQLGSGDRAVAGHDRPCAQGSKEVLEDLDGTEYRIGEQERGAAVEEQVGLVNSSFFFLAVFL